MNFCKEIYLGQTNNYAFPLQAWKSEWVDSLGFSVFLMPWYVQEVYVYQFSLQQL